MAVPPSYGDIGKSARDLFSKGFNYGFYKFEVKTKTSNGIDFTTNGSSNHENAKFGGGLETKYKVKKYGLTFTEKWNTDNLLSTEMSVEDQMAKGLKIALESAFSPQSGKKSGKLKTSYKRPYLNASCDADLKLSGPILLESIVIGYEGFLAGAQISLDTSKYKLVKSNFAGAYLGKDFELSFNANNGSEFTGAFFNKASHDIHFGVQVDWNSGTNDTKFAVAARYVPDRDSTFRIKLNNQAQFGLSYQQNLKDGLDLTLSTLVEGKNFSAGGHKVGLGLNFEI